MKKLLFTAIIIAASISVKAQKHKTDTSQIFTSVDKVPEFPGGTAKFKEYTDQSITKTIRKDNKSGLVVVVFIVEKDGSITNPQAIMPLNPESDSIAVNIVRKMKKWEPAIKNGKAVRCKFSIPLRFGPPDPNSPPIIKEREN